MKRLLLIVCTLAVFAPAIAAEKKGFEIVSKSSNELVVKVRVSDFRLIQTGNSNGVLPSIENGARNLEKGYPALQHLTTSIILEGNKLNIQVLDSKHKIFSGVDVLPSKGNIYRDQDPSQIPYVEGPVYSSDKYYPSEVAVAEQAYTFRDFRGVPLRINPMQYNPVSRELKLYTEITLRITFSGKHNNPATISRDFFPLYKNQFLNFGKTKYQPSDEKGGMLVLTHQNFVSSIKPLVDFKNQIGIPTTLVRIDTLSSGSVQDIKNFISTFYQQNNLAFVLLVGDAGYVPVSMTASGHSDNAYGYLSGSDSYPEVIVGRFSAEQASHVETMVNRTISYETGVNNNNDWLNTVLGLSSNQGPGDDNEMDYEHIRNMHTDLQAYSYINMLEMFDGSQGGNDAPSNPTAAMVSQALNHGVGNILYTGHGSTYSWGSSGFATNDIDQLTNTTSWPFIFSVACVNGNFVNNTCFAESWTRANLNGEPTGAIAALMSTINQSWDPPMHAQDEMVDILTESFQKNIKRTFGGISIDGCMEMNDAYGNNGSEMTDTWNIFGDPSVMLRTDTSRTAGMTYSPVLFTGDTSITVSSSHEGARIAVSVDSILLDVDYITNGQAILTFPPFLNPDTLTLALVAYNHDILFEELPVTIASGPYIRFKNLYINDQAGNSDQGADQGEQISLDVMLENIGLDNGTGINAVLATNDTSIVIIKQNASWGLIPSKDSSATAGAFEIDIKPGIKNGHKAKFNLHIVDNAGGSWQSSFEIPLEAPEPKAAGIFVNDTQQGNADHRMNAGETAIVEITVVNDGKSDFSYAWCSLNSSSTYFDVNKPFNTIKNLKQGQDTVLSFEVYADSTIPDGTTIALEFAVTGGPYADTAYFYETIGNVQEDFESQDFNRYNWNPQGTYGWKIDTTEAHAGNTSAVSGLPYGQHGSISALLIAVTTLADDSISFYRKVSCEDGYDFMKFFINNVKAGEWTGFDDWKRVSFAVPAGSHVFKWTYEKDMYVSNYADKVWIDDVSFPVIATPAGEDELYDFAAISIYPNPANNKQFMEFSLNRSSEVKVNLLDATGRKISELVNEEMQAGSHKTSWDLSGLPSGLYFVQVNINGNQQVFKIIH